MSSSTLKQEVVWFLCSISIALVCGIVTGWPLSVVTLSVFCYIGWVLYRMEKIVSWLRDGANVDSAPHSLGLTDEMIQLIHREKKYSRKQKNRWRKSLAQFNSLAGNLPDAIIVIDKHFQIRWSNPAARTLLNIHPEKDRGQRVDNLIRSPSFSEFLSPHSLENEVEILSPTAAQRILEIRKVPSMDAMTVLIAADITQRFKTREMRKAFVADVSHELRTPLTVIRGYMEMLQEMDSQQPEVLEALHQVSLQSDRMRGIVDALLELSKLESNPLNDDEGDTVDMASMILTMVAPLKKEAPQHHFQLLLEESLALLGSEQELYSACNNLLTNAVKYTEPGSTINVTWRLDEMGMARYSVADDGAGIEPRHLSRLSERFYRVDKGRSRDKGGTGLGLAIVKHAVQRHGGQLEIKSIPGTGSQFTAVFPASRVRAMHKAANQ